MPYIICIQCKKTFYCRSIVANGKKRKYCSPLCYHSAPSYKRTKEHKIKMKLIHRGMNAWNWKGDKVGNRGLHLWVHKKLGKPSSCKHCGKKGGYYTRRTKNGLVKVWSIQLANKSGKYLRDLNDWIHLCISCHLKYDRGREMQEGGTIL